MWTRSITLQIRQSHRKTVIQIAPPAPAGIEGKHCRKPDAYATRYWALYVDGELPEATLYQKGARVIAGMRMRMRGRKKTWDAA